MQKYYLTSPFYLMTSITTFCFSAALGFQVYRSLSSPVHGDHFGLSLAVIGTLFFLIGYFFLNRGLKSVEISPRQLEFKNLIGISSGSISCGVPDIQINIEKRSHLKLDGPRIEEDTLLKKTIGTTIRALVLLGVIAGSFRRTAKHNEDFIVISTTHGTSRTQILVPDVYRWNQKGFTAILSWLESNSLKFTNSVEPLNPEVISRGYYQLAGALIMMTAVLGVAIYIFTFSKK